MKLFKKFIAVAITGPLVALYYLLSRHWFINSSIGLAIALLFPFSLPASLPLTLALNFAIGFSMSATSLGLVQQIIAFIYNASTDQCEMMMSSAIPEISYAAYRGILHVNQRINDIDMDEVDEFVANEDNFYGRSATDALLVSGGFFSCRGQCFLDWQERTESELEMPSLS